MSEIQQRKNTFIVGFFTLISRLLGIIRLRVVSSFFGAGSIADVINFTFSIPNNFRKLFSEGALSSAIIPEFSILKDNEEETQKLHYQLLSLQLIIGIVIMVISLIFATPIINFLSSFKDPEQLNLASKLLPYYSLFLVFIIFASYFSAILQSRSAFLVQSIAPLFYTISIISIIYLLTGKYGPLSIGIGTALGGFLQFFITFIRLKKENFKFKLFFHYTGKHFHNVMKKWLPAILTALIGVVGQQVSFYFASCLGEGSVSAFANSLIFWQMPYGIFYTSVASVTFPLLASNRGDKLNKIFSDGFNQLTTFLLPSAIVVYFFRNEIISVILMTGKFTLENTILTGQVLVWYLVGMLIIAWYNFIQKLCYSKNSEKLALYVSIFVTVVDIVITFVLIKKGFNIISLPIANLISHLIGMIILMILTVKRELTNFNYKPIFIGLLKRIVALIPLIVFCLYYQTQNNLLWQMGSSLQLLGQLLINLVICVALSLGMYKLLKINIL